MYDGVEVKFHIFLAMALIGGEWSSSCSDCFISRETILSINWIGSWKASESVLTQQKKKSPLSLPGIESQLPSSQRVRLTKLN
jgi:hypothetical protein